MNLLESSRLWALGLTEYGWYREGSSISHKAPLVILSVARLSLRQYTFCVLLLLSKKNVCEIFYKKILSLFSRGVRYQKLKSALWHYNTAHVTILPLPPPYCSCNDRWSIAAAVYRKGEHGNKKKIFLLISCDTLLRRNFYQLQATCKIKEKRACHTLFFYHSHQSFHLH